MKFVTKYLSDETTLLLFAYTSAACAINMSRTILSFAYTYIACAATVCGQKKWDALNLNVNNSQTTNRNKNHQGLI
jgi:hypothetical protein